MPRYEYVCKCGVFEEVRGFEEDSAPCPSCGDAARRNPVNLPYIRGETVPKGQATRAGNIKDKKGRYRVSLFQEASEQYSYETEKAVERGEPEGPSPYKAGMERARRMGAKINAKSG